jgi:tRNA G18 (ribose-2'-O)-methylase SpoU
LADYLVEIPLRGRKNSLNVANAYAIAAGEISRQKSLTHREMT